MRILVVEDDRKVASFIRKGLTEEGYAVDVASDGGTGLAMGLDRLHLRNAGRALTRTMIAEHVWDYSFDSATLNCQLSVVSFSLDFLWGQAQQF